MADNSGFIFYLLLISAFLLVVLPLTLLLIYSTAKLIKKIAHIVHPPEQRSTPRLYTTEMLADLTNGKDSAGTTCNISSNGICLQNLPANFKLNVSKLMVKLIDRDKTFTLTIIPKWERLQDEVKSLGAMINEPPD